MPNSDPTTLGTLAAGAYIADVHRQAEVLRTVALQRAILNSTNFSSIATDAQGVIQIFNVGAERMLGYAAIDVMNKITPADLSDPQELIERATALSDEYGQPIAPGFEALVFKASRGIEDIYELTCIRKDGSRFPALVSVTALRDAQDGLIGYLLIGTDNTARKKAEELEQHRHHLEELVLSRTAELAASRDAAEAASRAERHLKQLSRVDPLTGLSNRRNFEEHLEQAMARSRRSRRSQHPMTLVFIDVDHFKQINDTHGHTAGDAVLKEFAARLRDRRALRATRVAV